MCNAGVRISFCKGEFFSRGRLEQSKNKSRSEKRVAFVIGFDGFLSLYCFGVTIF